MQLASVGIELSLSVVIGLLGGRWLDRKLGTDPYLSLVGLLIGVAAGFRSLILAARKAQAEANAASADDTTPDTKTPPAEPPSGP
jgi:ATP synthase protein I